MAGSHHFWQRLLSPDAADARSGENPHEHWRLTTSPDQDQKTEPECSHGCGRANLSDLRLPCPPPAPGLGGGLHLLWREAMALRGRRARGLCLSAVPGDLAGEACGGSGRREEVGGGSPPEAGCALIWVPWESVSQRGRSPP